MKKQPAKQKPKPVTKTASVKSSTKTVEPKILGPSFFERFETFAEANSKWLIWLFAGISLICSILLFDLKPSIGGDDSSYVERAYLFITNGTYPYYQGPGYHLVLAGIIKIFGFKLGVMKVFSVLFYTGHIILTWLAFRKKIPYMMLMFMVGFAAVSDYMQYYASQTWNEAFYLFVQAFVLWLVMKVVSIDKQEESIMADIKKRWYLWLGIGLAFTFLAMTKTVAIFGVGAPVVYFIFQKKYRYAIFVAVCFIVIKLGVNQTEKALYGPSTNTTQWQQMMLKDAYKPNEGTLDAAGFIGRFAENLKTYSSMHFMRFLHIIPKDRYRLSENGSSMDDEKGIAVLVTLLVCSLLAYSTYRIYKENKQAFFLVLFTIIMCGGIFFGIHANNRQDRLIIILFPFILFILLYGLYITVKNFRALHGVIAGIAAIILLSSFYNTLAKAPESITTLQKNLGSEPYYGYTEDWVNYVTMGDWCKNNLPEGSIIACRKPTILFITTGKSMWYGVHNIESEDGDYWLKRFKEAKVTHILVADLRAMPAKKTNRLISTLHKVGRFILQKYPNKLKLIHVEGVEEKASLYEIRYND